MGRRPRSFVPNFRRLTDDLLQQVKAFGQLHGPALLLAVVAVLAFFLAIKAVKFILKLFFVLLAFAAVGGVVWWFFFRTPVAGS